MSSPLQKLLDAGLSPRMALEELRRHENQSELETLVKHQWASGDVINKLQGFGWKFGRQGGNHKIYVHPGIPGALVAIKHEHARGNLSPNWVDKYFKDAGLKWNQHDNGVKPRVGHPYAQHYAALGFT